MIRKLFTQDTVHLSAKATEMAKDVATNLMKHKQIHDAVVKIAKEIRDVMCRSICCSRARGDWEL